MSEQTAGIKPGDGQKTPLAEEIRRRLRKSGFTGLADDSRQVVCIPFRDYMSLCLYHPKYGYYTSGRIRTGREGDFYTSAFVGDIMGEMLAERLASMAEERFAGAGRVDVIDYGGGTGRLSRQMLDRWAAMGEAGERFALTLVDGNPAHLEEAGVRLEPYIQQGSARILTPEGAEAENWKDRPVMIVANELLDAFPVMRIACKDGRLWEQGVYEDSGGNFSFCLMDITDPEAERWLADRKVRLREGQKTEIGLEAARWIAGLGARLDTAVLVLIDYGDSTRELTAEYRMDGTLLCYEKHTASSDPFANPGGQDMTAHVDFDLVLHYAEEAGWKQLWYGTQKDFLVESGILGKLAAHAASDPFHPLARRNRAIRQLLLSDGMSELFKVMILTK
jgi:SAM-dependent MidA family methyltransferase